MNKKLLAYFGSATLGGLFLLAAFNLMSPWSAMFIIAVFILSLLLREKIWLFLPCVPVSLLLGHIFTLEIRPRWFYEINAGELLLVVIAMMFVFQLIIGMRTKSRRIGATGWFLLAYTMLALASFFYIKDVHLYVAGMKVLLFSMAAYLLGIELLNTPFRVKAMGYGIGFFVLGLGLQIIFALSQGSFSLAVFSDRAAILFPYGPLALAAAALSLAVPYILGLYFSAPRYSRERLFFILCFLIGVVAIFVTLGKAAMLSLCAGLLYFSIKMKGKRVILVLTGALFISASLIVLYPYTEGFVERIRGVSRDTTTTFRIKEYQAMERIISEHPWRGVGVGEQLNQYRRLLQPNYGELANNFLLQATMDLGVPGLMLYCGLVISIFLLFYSKGKQAGMVIWGLGASLLAAFVNGMFEVTMFAFQYAILAWLIISVARSLITVQTSVPEKLYD